MSTVSSSRPRASDGWELFVYGGAFGLPSVDPECNAAVALLTVALSKGSQKWTLHAHHSPSQIVAKKSSRSAQAASNATSFPCLRTGPKLVCGYKAIVRHLDESGLLPAEMQEDKEGKANSTAISSLVSSQGGRLFRLYAYATSSNYDKITRPALLETLPWPSRWISPRNIEQLSVHDAHTLGIHSLQNRTLFGSSNSGFSLFKGKQEKQGKGSARTIDTIANEDEDDNVNERSQPTGATQGTSSEALLGMDVQRVLVPLAQKFAAPLESFLALPQSGGGPPQETLREDEFVELSPPALPVRCTPTTLLAYGYLSLIYAFPAQDDWLPKIFSKTTPKLSQLTYQIASQIRSSQPEEASNILTNTTSTMLSSYSFNFFYSPNPSSAPDSPVSRVPGLRTLIESTCYLYQTLTPSIDIISPPIRRQPKKGVDQLGNLVEPQPPTELAWSLLSSPSSVMVLFAVGLIVSNKFGMTWGSGSQPGYITFKRS